MSTSWPDHLPPRLIFGVILCTYLLLGGLYAAYTPAWQAPDEPAHYNYVRYLAESGRFPVLHYGDYPHAYLEQIKSARFPPDMSIDPIRYEFWQPPLYYVLAAPLYRLFGGALLPLRLLSVILGAGVVAMAYAIVLAWRPGDTTLALAAAAFVAFIPMHLTMVASVNNDPLAELLLAAVMLLLIRLSKEATWSPRGCRYLVAIGLLLGLGLVTKATVYIAIPLGVIALLLLKLRPAPLAGRTLALFGVALALAIPWYVRNLALYGWPDLLGVRNHDAVVVGQLRTEDYLAAVGGVTYLKNFTLTSFQSFWGQFGWMAVPMDRRIYLALALLSALIGAGCVLAVWRRRTAAGADFVLIALWLTFTILIYVYYNLSLVQFQGRYLFPALIPIGILAALGLREITSRRRGWVAAGICGIAAGIIAFTSLANGELDKWGLLIAGGAALALIVRRWLPAWLDGWVLAAVFAGLAGLSLVSLFAFVVPYLHP